MRIDAVRVIGADYTCWLKLGGAQTTPGQQIIMIWIDLLIKLSKHVQIIDH
jgi:hypothetical protein